MKNYYLTLLCFCLSTFFYGQIDSVLFGLSRTPGTSSIAVGGTVYLARVNASSGVVTNVSPSSIGTGIQMFSAAIDSYNNIYYYVNMNNQLVGLSLTSGTIVSSATISSNNISEIIFNCSDTTIYGLAHNYNGTVGSVYLAKINPATGVITNISSSSIASGIQLVNATIDPYNKIYYFVNESGSMVGLSLTTGAIVSSVVLTNTNGQYFSQMTYNRSDSTIYGLARGITTPTNPSTGCIYLAKVDPTTGTVTNISSTSLATGMNASIGTIDPYNKIFYFFGMNGNFVGASLLTGAMVTNPLVTYANAQYLDQVVFNCNFCPHAKPANGSTGIKELTHENLFRLYPNPSPSGFAVDFEKAGNYKVEILTIDGQVVWSETLVNTKRADLKTAGLSRGIYYCKITGADKEKVVTQKILIE